MKIGFSVATPDVDTPLLPAQQGDFTENISILADLGYDGVEVSIRDPETIDLKMLERETASRGLEVASIHTAAMGFQDQIWLCHPDEKIRFEASRRLLAAVDIAANFGVGVLVGSFRGKLGSEVPREVSESWMFDAFKKSSDYANSKGSKILFEPQARSTVDFGFTAQEGLKFADQLQSPGFGLMLDTYHMNIEEASFSKSIFDAREYLSYLQISDSNRLYPGAGHINFGEIINSLAAIHFDGFLSLQILREPDFITSARLGLMHLRSIINSPLISSS